MGMTGSTEIVSKKPAVRVRKQKESELKLAEARLEQQIKAAREEIQHIRSRLDGLMAARDILIGARS